MRWERDFRGCIKESLWSRQNCCVEVYSWADLRPGASQRDLIKDQPTSDYAFQRREPKRHGRQGWEVWKKRNKGENGSVLERKSHIE